MDWNVLLEKTIRGSEKAKLLGQFMSLIYIIKRKDKEIVFKMCLAIVSFPKKLYLKTLR